VPHVLIEQSLSELPDNIHIAENDGAPGSPSSGAQQQSEVVFLVTGGFSRAESHLENEGKQDDQSCSLETDLLIPWSEGSLYFKIEHQ
jgi:hypothetical protein